MSRISIIIPNLNQASKLDRCLNALTIQIKEDDLFEIIVVDNGSNDNSLKVAQNYNVRLLEYLDKKSPYAARNYGIKKSQGSCICLMDSKCVPGEDYVSELIKQTNKEGWDIVGGKFYYLGLVNSSSIAEIAYSMLFLKTDPKYFSGRISALTGNMVVKKDVFNEIGYFNERRAGGDVEFVDRAYKNKLNVIFNKNLIAGYEPQKKEEVIKSVIRNKRHSFTGTKLKSIRPPGINYFFSRLSELNLSLGLLKKLRLYLFIWRLRCINHFTRTIS